MKYSGFRSQIKGVLSLKLFSNIILNGMPLEQVETFKYLGVLLSSELSWSAHIESKARKLTGLLYRRFYDNVNQQSMYSL